MRTLTSSGITALTGIKLLPRGGACLQAKRFCMHCLIVASTLVRSAECKRGAATQDGDPQPANEDIRLVEV